MTQSNLSPSSFVQQNERNASRTRSPRGKVPVIECFDGLARITSKELASIHSVKSGCLPCNDCNKKQEKNHRCLLAITNTNNGRHAVHLLHGGIGKVHGGLLTF